MDYIVSATSLNLRREPQVMPGNRVAVLSQGHRVRGVGPATDPDWIMVSTEVDGQPVTGFVARRYLALPSEAPAVVTASSLTAVHLRTDDAGSRRDVAGKRACALAEPGSPRRVAADPPADRRRSVHAILDWLDVEQSARYQPGSGRTYCNIYAHDFCYLADTYLPRVWWTPRAASDLLAGRDVQPRYDHTIVELNANALFEWLREFGDGFGWVRGFELDAVQGEVNQGGVGLICAQRVELNQPGHIAMVVPESPDHAARRTSGKVVGPLQSQAGATNRARMTTTWWQHLKFRQFGYWTHA